MTPSRFIPSLSFLSAAVFLVLPSCSGLIVDGGGSDGEEPELSLKSVPSDSVAGTFRLTHYTLVTEAETSGQHTGVSAVDCNAHGLSGCYHREFLCSGYGVAMQGTGIANNGKYIQYVSGGGGWTSGYKWLKNCDGARFAVTDGVRGSSGRLLVEDYSIAVDRSVIPLGWYVWIDSEGHWFRADDTGGAIDGKHIDIYMGTSGQTPNASSSRVFVTRTPHDRDDPSPYGDGGGGGGGGGGDDDSGGGTDAPATDDDPCGGLDFQGECRGDTLRWCQDGALHQADCAAWGLVCGWQDSSTGYNCVSGSSGGTPSASCGDGSCDGGETCSSCPSDCGSCTSSSCGDGSCDGGETCSSCPSDCGSCPPADQCGGLDYLGECQGDVVRWCEGGQVLEYDCGAVGKICDWVSTTVGYACVTPSSGGACGSGHLGTGENGDSCYDPPETWRCVYSDHWAEWASQVCRGGKWVTFHLSPADCEACCGDYSSACY